MIQFKACPRCHGDLISGEDHFGSYLSCIQCGRYINTATKARGGAAKRSSRKSADLASADLAVLLAA